MKKIIYSFTALLLLCLGGCEETNNLAGGGVSEPHVTIYSYTIPAGTDADATVNLRFMPNQACAEFYVLVEKKADKDAFLAKNDEREYAARVVELGQKYPAKDLDYLNETLAATYAITAVGVSQSGTKGNSVEYIFNGVEWSLVGNVIYSDPVINVLYGIDYLDVPVKWYVSANLEKPIYKLEGRFDSLDPDFVGSNIKLSWDDTGKITFLSGVTSPTNGMWRLETPFLHPTYGAIWQEVDLNTTLTYYNATSKLVNIYFRRAVSAGTFAGWYDMTIKLP
ncbi:MAG: hypothetical protein LBJ72_03560 [Dysgonamonadaceae bacterium]|jgi:hypothetical protein|nr:hypothetical protein [Dysgonamonadaceae bacterium]